jgi:hypothetical protein
VVLAGIITAWLVLLFVLATRAARVDRRRLRRCPVCGARAIRAAGYREIDVIQTRAALQCGQCGLWRRLNVTRAEQHSHDRRIERDRRRMRRTMLRLETERSSLEVRAFVTALRADVEGADDFLAVTRGGDR